MFDDKLIEEVRNNNFERVKELVHNGASASFKNSLSVKLAAETGNIEMLQFLIDNGGNVFDKENSEDFKDALCYACHAGHLEMVNYLIKLGVGINKLRPVDNYDLSAIEYALDIENLEIVMALKKAGASSSDYYRHYDNNITPLMLAVKRNDYENLDLLLKFGEDLNKFIPPFKNDEFDSDYESTILHYALKNSDLKMFSYLIEKGALINQEDFIECLWHLRIA